MDARRVERGGDLDLDFDEDDLAFLVSLSEREDDLDLDFDEEDLAFFGSFSVESRLPSRFLLSSEESFLDRRSSAMVEKIGHCSYECATATSGR